MSDLITVKNLVEIYSDGTKAVDDISFSVKEQEFFGFLGPNGAGKSTTIKILTTLLRKTSGSVTVAGHDIFSDAAEIRKIIGVQSQETTVDGDLTGRENIMLQGHFQQMESNKLKKRVDELLQLVGLESAADKRARNYSGGMKKRVGLARAIALDPKIVFYDDLCVDCGACINVCPENVYVPVIDEISDFEKFEFKDAINITPKKKLVDSKIEIFYNSLTKKHSLLLNKKQIYFTFYQ